MNRSIRWGLPTVAALSGPLLAPAVVAVAEPSADHCYAEAQTIEEVQAGATAEVSCYLEPQEASPARGVVTLAVHYQGSGGSGASLTISGPTCAGASIAFAASSPWNNKIRSTRHQACGSAKHFANPDLTGDNETTTGSPGSLSTLSATMGNHVSSVGYDT